MSGLTTQGEWQKHFRVRSWILNSKGLFDEQGRPKSSSSYSFTDGKEYLEELVSLRRDAYGPKGLIEICKEKLRTAKSDWQYSMTARHTPDVKPKGQALIDINRMTARLKVYREEARAINAEIKKENKSDDAKLLKQQKKWRYKGFCNRKDGEVWRCDFRLVEDRKFLDDGSGLDEYLAENKKRNRVKNIAARKIEKAEISKIEKAEDKKLQQMTNDVEKETQKIMRRRKPPLQPTAA